MKLTRRRFLYYLGLAGIAATAITLAPTVPRREPIPPESIVKVQSAKRLGSFEESGRAVVEWLERNQFKPETLQQFGIFKAGLGFDIDAEIDVLVKSTMGQANKRGVVRKGEYVFELNITPHSKALITFFGKIAQEITIGNSDVYMLDFVIGEPVDLFGRQISETNRIYVYQDRVKNNASNKNDLFSRYLAEAFNIFREHRDEINNLLTNKECDWNEFLLLCRELAKKYNIPLETILVSTIVLKLSWKDKEKYGSLKTEEDKKRAIEDHTFSALIHEMTHRELEGVNNAAHIPFNTHIDELFSILIELAYGGEQYSRMKKLLAYSLNTSASPPQYVWSARVIINDSIRLGYGFKGFLNGDEQGIRELALQILHQISIEKFGKPFAQVVDIPLFDQARKFVASIN